jgi:SPP1 family predicted phage head-tail adaptor
MSDPGRLKHRVVLEAPVESPDGAGGISRSYAAAATLWAALAPVSARGDVVGAGFATTVTHRLVIRRGPEVTTDHRFRLGTRIFRIVAIREEDSDGRYLEIQSEERTD